MPYEEMREELLDERERSPIRRCRVATTADNENDDVYVTFPFDDEPARREIIDYWNVATSETGAARYPVRGDVGMVMEMDTGELWLIF